MNTENHMIRDDERVVVEIKDITDEVEATISTAIERIKESGELDEIIEGTTRQDWTAYYIDAFTDDENAANLINPELDANDTMRDILDDVDVVIRQVMERNYYG